MIIFEILSLLLVKEEFEVVIFKTAILSHKIEKNTSRCSILKYAWEHHAPDHP